MSTYTLFTTTKSLPSFNNYRTMKFFFAIILILAVIVTVQSAPLQLDNVALQKREAGGYRGGAAQKREAEAGGYRGGAAQK
ncbi:hypothetical protein RhiirA5_415959, partial [Rhizophagus irregularis]